MHATVFTAFLAPNTYIHTYIHESLEVPGGSHWGAANFWRETEHPRGPKQCRYIVVCLIFFGDVQNEWGSNVGEGQDLENQTVSEEKPSHEEDRHWLSVCCFLLGGWGSNIKSRLANYAHNAGILSSGEILILYIYEYVCIYIRFYAHTFSVRQFGCYFNPVANGRCWLKSGPPRNEPLFLKDGTSQLFRKR